MSLLSSMQSLPVSEWITDSDYGFPIMLSLHSIGLSMMVGIQIMLALRVLGFGPATAFSNFRPLIYVAWVGFIINAISGSFMFMAEASRLIVNWSFLAKMSCVIFAAVLSLLLWRHIRDCDPTKVNADPIGGSSSRISLYGRILATALIVMWIGAICFGRIIAYVMDRAILRGEI
jgi:hypothetical protein